jgi:hypothetical protein
MYGYLITTILIFLTHPGVAYNFFDPGVPGAIFQAIVVFILQLPSDSGAGFSNVMGILYYVALALWAYIKVRMILNSTK